MTATIVGPGGAVEIDNSDAVPIEVTIVGGGGGGGGDASEATLQLLLAELQQKLESFPADFPDVATAAKAEAIRALLAAEDFASDARLEAVRLLLAGTLTVQAAALPLPAGAAEQTTLLLALAKLGDIFGAVDGLEVTAGNIDISNTSIGLNVDEVEAILRTIRDNFISEDFATQVTAAAILARLMATLTVAGTVAVSNADFPLPAGQVTTLAPLALQPVSATDLDIRNLALAQDSVRQSLRPLTPYHATVASGATGTIVASPTQRIRVIRIDGGCPATVAAGVFPVYAINLDIGAGDQVVRGKTLQSGEPLGCTVCLEGIAGADLTVTVSGGGSIEIDLYYEFFT